MIKNCPICKEEFYVRPCYIRYGRGKFCSRKCFGKSGNSNWEKNLILYKKGHISWNNGKTMPQVSKQNHWNWKGGHYKNSNGYVYVLKPNHPFAKKNGYVAEHRLIFEKHLGRYINPSEYIHHINGIKDDNRLENLKLFNNESDHLKLHHPKGKPLAKTTGRTHFKKGQIPWNKGIHSL